MSVLEQPYWFTTTTITSYFPCWAYTWLGEASMDVLPSPISQLFTVRKVWSLQPCVVVMVRSGLNCPAVAYKCCGSLTFEDALSPNFQAHEAMLPSLATLWSVKSVTC